jgi:hypothetical protein
MSIPVPCQPLAQQIRARTTERTQLQAELHGAPPAQRSQLIQQIRQLNTQISGLQRQLDDCVQQHSTRTYPIAQGDDMQPGEALTADQSISSASGRHTFVYQGDGNLVLYKNYPNRERRWQWDSNTNGRPTQVCIMQGDGNLVIYGPNEEYIWDSRTDQHPGSRLLVQDDGNVVIYRPDNIPVWATDTPRIILHQRIATMDGWVEVILRPDGTVRFRGHIHNSAPEPFEFRIRTIVRSGNSIGIAMQRSGHIGGWLPGESRNEDWDESSFHPLVKLHYEDIELDARLEVYENHRGDITGSLEEIADVALRWLGGSILIGSGVGLLIFVGAELGSLIATGSFVPAARIVEGVLWLAGPWGTLYALAAEGVAAVGSRTRELTQEEIDFAEPVFAGTLPPRDRLVLTDTIGGEGRFFVFPRYDGKITINMGPDAFADPRKYGTRFIHELTHTWQIHHTNMDLSWLADALATQVCYSLTREGYDPGPAGPPFSDFNLEQQATIVERWFAAGMEVNHQYYRYIEQNIRIGRV